MSITTLLPMRALLLIASLAPAALQAQQADTVHTDSAYARVVRYARVIVTASRIPLTLDRLGIATSVLTAADIAARRPPTAADALRDVTGVFVDEAAGTGGPTIVRVRGGEEVFTQILMDGVQVNQNGGFFDFQGLTLSNVDRVEVVRGPQSALFGSSAMSGAVQLITRAGHAGPPEVQLDLEGGQATGDVGGAWRAHAALSGGSGTLRYSAALGSAFDRGFYALPHDTRTLDASVRVDADVHDGAGITGVARFIGVESMLPVRDPGATRAPLDPNATNTRERMLGSVRAHHGSRGNITHELGFNGYREFFVYDDEFDDVASAGDYPFFIFDANFTLRSTLQRGGAEYVGRWSGSAGDAPVSLAWGALFQRESLVDRSVFEGNRSTARFARNGGAAFAEASVIAATRLNVLAGARIERFGDLTSDVTPRISATFAVAPGRLSIRGAAGTAYKSPNLQEQYADNPFIAANPDLEPETSSSVEAGFDARALGGRVAINATAFQQRFENQIRTVPLEGTGRQINRNLGASRARGVEWEARLSVWQGWTLGSDGALIRTRIIDNSGLSPDAYPVDGELPFRPLATASAFIERTSGSLNGMLRLRYIGEQTVLSERFGGERVALDPYVVLGANASYAITSTVAVHLRADNVFDTAYETAFDRPGAPVRASLGVTWRNR